MDHASVCPELRLILARARARPPRPPPRGGLSTAAAPLAPAGAGETGEAVATNKELLENLELWAGRARTALQNNLTQLVWEYEHHVRHFEKRHRLMVLNGRVRDWPKFLAQYALIRSNMCASVCSNAAEHGMKIPNTGLTRVHVRDMRPFSMISQPSSPSEDPDVFQVRLIDQLNKDFFLNESCGITSTCGVCLDANEFGHRTMCQHSVCAACHIRWYAAYPDRTACPICALSFASYDELPVLKMKYVLEQTLLERDVENELVLPFTGIVKPSFQAD